MKLSDTRTTNIESGQTIKIEFPGLFDLQVNGFNGVDFNNPLTTTDDMFHAINSLRATGVTRFLPTLITSSLERFSKCAKTLTRIQLPEIVGIHMEGPYVCPEGGTRGAHPCEHVIAASIDDFTRRQEAAGGRIRLVTLAPEVHGAIRLIEYLVTSDIRVAIGHTAASPEQIRDAVKAGATLSTHLGNGCAHSLPRHPNFIWEQLANDDLSASLIVDGHHLPPATVKAMIRAKTPGRTLLVTDAVAAAGCAPGTYELNGEQVLLSEDGRVSPPGKPWMAGSAITLEQAMANTVKFTGLPLEKVLPMASTQPAKYLGITTFGQVTADWNSAECRLSNLKVSDS
ncbi:MAG TPA: amidohydrolase family protein [Verrucomicrobiae bacterium]|nr:amidohydrolase family protein [Verrucomicrobiae bacterium]